MLNTLSYVSTPIVTLRNGRSKSWGVCAALMHVARDFGVLVFAAQVLAARADAEYWMLVAGSLDSESGIKSVSSAIYCSSSLRRCLSP